MPVYASEVMPETPDEVRRIAERAVDAGYDALKLGWGPLGRDLGHDESLVRAARDTLGPERTLMLDGGLAYTVKRALELLRRVEELDMYWLEEPLAPTTTTATGGSRTRPRPDRRRRGRLDAAAFPRARGAGPR